MKILSDMDKRTELAENIFLKNHKIVNSSINYNERVLPIQLVEYLDDSRSCVNPRCRGVYFDARVEHVKFVDFCGTYRIPLMQYLCSSKCRTGLDWTDDATCADSTRMRRVLLG